MKTIDLNLNQTRRTVINWPNELREIIDRYRGWTTISHGVQKDAIQNAWDARRNKNEPKEWRIEFELVENKGLTLFVFTDSGTSGLTGKVLTPEELQLDLPIEERWGRFENVAFTKEPSEKALGARGRGKFIFVGASMHEAITNEKQKIQNLILYDSLRPDGSYRFGLRTIITTDSPVQSFEEEEGKSKLTYYTNGLLSPLKIIGTRVIIVDPISELVENVKNGNFIRSIEETWWQIIKEYDAKIFVKSSKGRDEAKLLQRYEYPGKDTKRFKVWKRQNIKLPGAPVYTIKNLHIVYDGQEEYTEDLRGVSIQRGGMKVCSIVPRYIDKSIANAISGYIEFSPALNDKMREDEGPEHYSYDFKKDIPRFVRQFIEDEYDKFFKEKLGINSGTRTKSFEKSRSAELKALYQMNKLAIQLGIIGKGMSTSKSGGGERVERPIKLQYGKFIFPNDLLRIDYDQKIKNIKLAAINDTKTTHQLGVRFAVVYNEQTEILTYVNNVEFSLNPGKSIVLFELPLQVVSEEIFRFKGKYSFFARLVSLNADNKGDIIHQIQRHFWVEENPPQKGIFEDIDKFEFPKEKETVMGFSTKSDIGGYIFSYNISHPAKRAVEGDENDFMKYLIELMSIELAWIDLRNKSPKIFSKNELEDPSQIVRGLSHLLGKIKFQINKSL